MKKKQFASGLLCVALAITQAATSSAFSNVYAENEVTHNEEIIPSYLEKIYDFSDVESVVECDDEDDCSITLQKNDDTFSTLLFAEPIKFYDEMSCSYEFIDNKIVESNDSEYAYVNKANSFETMFSYNSKDGILFKEGDYSIRMTPVTDINSEALLQDEDSYSNYLSYVDVYGDGTELQYSLNNSGLKECLYLYEKPETYSYSFEIQTTGLEPKSTVGTDIVLMDAQTGEDVIRIAPIYIVDSSDFPLYSYNNYYTLSKLSDDNYLVTMVLDEEFLNDENINYPCVVDPAIYPMRSGSVTGAYATQSGYTVVNDYFQVGSFNGTGESISYIKIEGLENKKWLNPEDIHKASLILTDCTVGYYNSGSITCYDSNSQFDIDTISYSQLISKIGVEASTVSVSGIGEQYSFDVTNIAKNWIKNQIGEGGFSSAYGLILRGNSVINRSFYKNSSGNNMPYLEIQHTYTSRLKNGIYKIASKYNGALMQYNGLSNSVTALSTSLSDIKKWRISEVGDRRYIIQPINDESQYLSISSNTIGTNLSISSTSFYWDINTNSDGSYRIMPYDFVNSSNGITYSGGSVLLNMYTNSSYKKWNINPIYTATVNSYYDNGYPVRYNESSVVSCSAINGYIEDISTIYRNLFGLDIVSNGTMYFNSVADSCKGTVSNSNINTLCTHSDRHTDAMNIARDFIKYYNGTNTLTNVYWTGHKTYDSIGYNRSFSWGNNGIYMLELCSSDNRVLNSEGVLMHELNHQYGASDHYHEILENGRCRGGVICSECGINKRPATCIMNQDRISLSSDDLICDGCKNEMINHLESHHTTE